MREDAERNRESIMAAAKKLIAQQGAEVSMQAIAAEAGLAVGTLYRHHPTKADLVAAVVDDSAERIADLIEASAAEVAAGADVASELRRMLRTIAARAAANQALRSAARSLGVESQRYLQPTPPPPGSPLARSFAGLDAVFAAARAAGVVRSDVERWDISVLLHGVFELPLDEVSRERYVDIVLVGLAAPLGECADAGGQAPQGE